MGGRVFNISEAIVARLLQRFDPDYSRKLSVDDEIIGYYVLKPRCILDGVKSLPLRENLDRYRGRNGVEGVALVLDPAYRGRGWGKHLMALPHEFGFDYVWGYQYKADKNIHHWLKRRRLVARMGQLFVTLQDLGR